MNRSISTIVIAAVLALALAGCGTSGSAGSKSAASSGPSAADKASMDKRTRVYIGALAGCQFNVTALTALGQFSGDTVTLSGLITEAKTACDDAGVTIANETDFDAQAVGAYAAVDTCKDGLGDLSDYIDTGAPSKAASAQAKLADCNAFFTPALAAINKRRVADDLPRLTMQGKIVAAKKPAPIKERSGVAACSTANSYQYVHNLTITMKEARLNDYLPRCNLAQFVADHAWEVAISKPYSQPVWRFHEQGARWELGLVTCRYSHLIGKGEPSYTAVRCTHGTTAVTFTLGGTGPYSGRKVLGPHGLSG